jgi:hypothetical protein
MVELSRRSGEYWYGRGGRRNGLKGCGDERKEECGEPMCGRDAETVGALDCHILENTLTCFGSSQHVDCEGSPT